MEDSSDMSEGDNKHSENCDSTEDLNMEEEGIESAKRLKTEDNNSCTSVDNTLNCPSGASEECRYFNNEGTSSTPLSIYEELEEILEAACNAVDSPIANVNQEARDTNLEDESSVSTPFENRTSSHIYSEDDLEHTSMFEVENENESDDEEEHVVMKKTKPKHNWFVVPEIINRQYGYSSKKKGSELFQRRCYGSLHCAQRLELMYKLDKHDGCVNTLNFNPSGTLLASGSDDLNVIIWDWKVGKPLLQYDTKHRSNVLCLKFLDLSGDLQIVTTSRDGQIRLSQVSVQEGLRSNRKLGSHKGACHKAATVQGEPHVVLSVGEDGLVLHYDVRDYKPNKLLCVSAGDGDVVALYSVHSNPLRPHEFCVSGRDYIIRSYDQRKCGDKSEPLNVYYPRGVWPPEEDLTILHVTYAMYSHNGSEILASYNDDDIYLFDVNGTPGSFAHRYQGHRNGATIKAVNFFGPKSEFIVSGSDCGNVYIWEKNTEAIVNWMMADDNGVTNWLEPHPQLPFLCTSGLDWDIKVWVPSCESEPLMTGLGKVVQSNKKARSEQFRTGFGENRIFWMLFRHFRQHTPNFMEEQSTPQSSRSSNSDSNSDAIEGVSDCSPS